LACGTSSADQIIPGHASMVHGCLRCPPCNLISTSGVCCSGVTALNYGYLNVLAGTARNAVVTGSDVTSVGFLRQNFQACQPTIADPENNTYATFDREFLRWMLSDGAGAILIEKEPCSSGLSLRIDWVEIASFANEMETCMYCGALKNPDGSMRTWREIENYPTAWEDGYFNLAQDTNVLNKEVVAVALKKFFPRVAQRHEMNVDAIDYFLPHLSSYIFQKPVYDTYVEIGFPIPMDKWFTNLRTKGNSGAASIYVILEELYSSGRLKSGQRILCGVPESARFTYAFMYLTVV
jgi:3-oxoacyl-[acyl-carrier-protein] synthase-3